MTSKPESHHSREPSSGHGSGRSLKRRSSSRHHQDEKLTAKGFMQRLQKHPVLTLIVAAVVFGATALFLVIQIAE